MAVLEGRQPKPKWVPYHKYQEAKMIGRLNSMPSQFQVVQVPVAYPDTTSNVSGETQIHHLMPMYIMMPNIVQSTVYNNQEYYLQ